MTEVRQYTDKREERLAHFLHDAEMLLSEGGEPSDYERLSARWRDIGDLGAAIKAAHEYQPPTK